MKNTIGSSISVTLFGESHGPAIGAVIDGLAPGIPVDPEFIESQLELRRPYGSISTPRREADDFSIISGVFEGMTTGTPVTIIIPNSAQHSRDYAKTRALARPGHADYTAYMKYHGYEDYRGGGHFSGRITAALVAAGAVALSALRGKGVRIGTHILRLGGISDRALGQSEADLIADIARLGKLRFAVLDENAAASMQEEIIRAAGEGDSVGGTLETVVTGLPAGIGEPWFDTLEGVLSHGIFSIPGIKGVQFGGGFDLADARGSDYNDPFCMQNGSVVSLTNNNGGINGGISNGMPILIRSAVKPTPSIHIEQETVDFIKGEDAMLKTGGRHDPAIIHRARVVVDSVTAIVLADMLAQRYGTDWLAAGIAAAADGAEKEALQSADTCCFARDKNIVLVGMPGSGKSTVGRLLADRLGIELIDTDEEIIRRAGMQIRDIFAQKGEEYFRSLESEVIRDVSGPAGRDGRGGRIIATGGGAVLRPDNVRALRENGTIVFLDRPAEDLPVTDDRPLSDERDKLCRMYEERMPVYKAAADVTVRISGTPEQAADAVLEQIGMN